VQVAYKNATAVAFNSVHWNKIQTFFKRVEGPYSLYITSCIPQPVAQELDKIHILYAGKFCRLTLGVGVLEQTCRSASIEHVLVYVRSV